MGDRSGEIQDTVMLEARCKYAIHRILAAGNARSVCAASDGQQGYLKSSRPVP